MRQKLLTVSIASYNIAPFIRNTADSLLVDEAGRAALEVIFVNDGSSDDTCALAREYEAKYPETFRVIDKPNGGYGSTINASLAVAQGKYYKLLDGDAWYDTDALAGFLRFLESAEADLVVSPYLEIRGEREILVDGHREIPAADTAFDGLQLANPRFLMHEIAVKTEKLRGLRRPIAEHCFYTDAEFVFYCVCASDSVARYDRPLYCYRLGVDGQSVSLTGIRKHYKDLPRVAERIAGLYETQRGLGGAKAVVLETCVKNAVYHTFHGYMLLERPGEEKKNLMAFDEAVKRQSPRAYAASNGSRLVRVLRGLRFRFYGPLCRVELRKLERETQS